MPAAFSPCAEAGILPDYKEFGKEKHDSRRAGEKKKKKVNQADKKRAMIHWNQLEIAQRKFFLFEEISKTQLLPNPRGE